MFRWNVHLEKKLRQLHSEGMLLEQMGEQLGCHPNSVRQKLIREGLSVPLTPRSDAWSDEDTEKLKKFVAQGLSYSRIAALLGNGKTRNACIGKAKRLGISDEKPRGKSTKSSDSYIIVDDRVIALFDKFRAATAFEIAETVGLEFNDVAEYANAKDRHRDLGSEASYRALLVAEMRAFLLEVAA